MKKIPYHYWTEEESKRFWEEIADSEYLWSKSFSRVNGKLLIDFLDRYLDKNGTILDFGSGAFGFLVNELLSQRYTVASYEPTHDEKEQPYPFKDHEYYLGEISGDDRQKFDTVICSEVVEHLHDEALNQVTHTISQKLKPGGMLIVTTPNNENLMEGAVYNPSTGKLFHPWQHVRQWSEKTIQTHFEGAGFSSVALHQVDFSYDRFLYEEIDRLKSLLDQTKAHAKQGLLGWFPCPAKRQCEKIYDTLEGAYKPAHIQQDNHHQLIGKGTTIVYVAKKNLP